MSEPGAENESADLTPLEAWSGYDLISRSIDVESGAEWDRKSSLEQRAINIITTSGVLVTLAFGFTTLIQRGHNFESLVGHDRWMLIVSVSLFVAAALVALSINFPLRYSRLRVTRLRRMLYLPLPNDTATPAAGQPPPDAQPGDSAGDPAGVQPSPAAQPDDSAGEVRIDSKLLAIRLRALLRNGQGAPTPVDVAVRRTVLRYELARGFIQVLADARSLNRTKAMALFISMALEVVAIGFLAAAVVYVVTNIQLTSAANGPVWTVTPGGPFTAKATKVEFTDDAPGNGKEVICTMSSADGALNKGTFTHSKLGSITGLSFTNCTGPDDIPFMIKKNSTFILKAISYSGGSTMGSLNDISATLRGKDCTVVINGTNPMPKESDGMVNVIYNKPAVGSDNPNGELFVSTVNGTLEAQSVTGCDGLINQGDPISVSADYVMTKMQTITHP